MNKKNSHDQKRKILVVDDDEGILDALQFLLESAGYGVETSLDGEILKSLEEDNRPDLILLDLLLSGTDGRTICQLLKSKSKTKNIPVIMISAHPTAKQASEECGAEGFIPKPFEMKTLLDKIENTLNLIEN